MLTKIPRAFFGSPIVWNKVQFPEVNFVDFVSQEGYKLQTYKYPVPNGQPKATIVHFHGWGTYGGKYAYLAKMFAEAGYEFVTYDGHNFGHSEGEDRGQMVSHANWFADAHAFVDLLPNDNLVAHGFSIGGTTALCLEDKCDIFKAHVLMGPANKINPNSFTAELIGHMKELLKKDPKATLFNRGGTRENYGFDWLDIFFDDPAEYSGAVYAQTLDELLKAIDVLNGIDTFNKPLHMTRGLQDEYVCIEANKAFFDTCPNDHKELIEFNTGHFMASDGDIIEPMVKSQIAFLDRLFA